MTCVLLINDFCTYQIEIYQYKQCDSAGILNAPRHLFRRHVVSDLVSGGNARPGATTDVAFWPCIKEQLIWHEQERFGTLRKVHTDYGRGRAWLRAVLNERSLERHLHAVINPDALSPFYEEWAFLLDQEKSSVLPNVAAGTFASTRLPHSILIVRRVLT